MIEANTMSIDLNLNMDIISFMTMVGIVVGNANLFKVMVHTIVSPITIHTRIGLTSKKISNIIVLVMRFWKIT